MDIITEGCAYIPKLLKKLGVANNRYLAIISTKEFQILHYKKGNMFLICLKDVQIKQRLFKIEWKEIFYFPKQ